MMDEIIIFKKELHALVAFDISYYKLSFSQLPA
jgi:hypothetical protein